MVIDQNENGRPDGEIPLPSQGAIFTLDGDLGSGTLAVGFSSPIQPPTLFTWTTSQRRLTPLVAIRCDVDFSRMQLSQATEELEVDQVGRPDRDDHAIVARELSAELVVDHDGWIVRQQRRFRRVVDCDVG